MTLIESLRANMPPGVPQLLQKRAGLEAVARVMVDSLYEVGLLQKPFRSQHNTTSRVSSIIALYAAL